MFIGLGNYIHLFTQPVVSARFWNALLNNAKYFAIHVAGRSADRPAAGRAAHLRRGARAREGIYRTLLFIPATLSVVIVGFIWRLIINPLWGLVGFPLLGNADDGAAHHLADVGLAVFRHPDGVPLRRPAGRAARRGRGGADRRRRGLAIFWTIKFPLIVPQFGLIVILTFIWTFNGFDLVFALNGSAPGPNYSTDILGTFFYRTFFGSSGQVADLDLGATVATVIFTLMLAVTAVYFWLVQRRLKPHAV